MLLCIQNLFLAFDFSLLFFLGGPDAELVRLLNVHARKRLLLTLVRNFN